MRLGVSAGKELAAPFLSKAKARATGLASGGRRQRWAVQIVGRAGGGGRRDWCCRPLSTSELSDGLRGGRSEYGD